MSFLWTIFGALAVIIGFTAQNIFIVFWLQASVVGPYGLLFLCGLAFVLVFFLSSLAFAVTTGDWSVFLVSDDEWERRLLVSPLRPSGFRLTHAQVLACSGFCNALNGILIVYASPASRTPPLIQAVLQNCGVLFSVPFSKMVLGDTKRYCAVEPLRAAAIVVASVCVALAPTLSDIAAGRQQEGGFDGLQTIAWVLVYIAGLAPNALLNVLQQLYFLRTGLLRADVTVHATRRGTLRALFFANLMQPLTYLLLWWVDVLPWFGSSSRVGDFFQNTGAGLACSVGAASTSPACPKETAAWAFAFMAAYILAYFGGASLNKESATFNMLCLVVVTTSTAVIWEIPGVNPRPSGTPVWSVVTSLILSLTGSALWKIWEARTPASEQFSVMRDDPDGGSNPSSLGWLKGRTTTFDGDSIFGDGASEFGADEEETLLANASGDYRLSFATPAGKIQSR